MDSKKHFKVEAVCKQDLENALHEDGQDVRDLPDFDTIFSSTFDQVIDIENIQEEIRSKLPSRTNHGDSARRTGKPAHSVLKNEKESIDIIEQNVCHSNMVWDVIAAANSRPGNPVKRRLYMLLMKFAGWPARKYFYPQIDFNGDMVRISNENIKLIKMLMNQIEAQNEKIRSQENEITALAAKFKKDMDDMESNSNFLKNAQSRMDEALMLIKNHLGEPSGFDYVGFENKYRGEWQEIQNRMRDRYFAFFENCRSVLDLGCGRGEFLSLLAYNNITARGVDMSQEMVEYCSNLGLIAEKANAIDYVVSGLGKGTDGIFCAQLVEHLTSVELMEFIHGCFLCLQEGGVIVFETINPTCLQTYRFSYPMDFTHQRFVHPLTLKFIMETVGFSDVKIEYYGSVRNLPEFPKDTTDEVKLFMSDIQSSLFSEQDYAVIATK